MSRVADDTLTRRSNRALGNAFLRKAVRFTAERLSQAKNDSTDALGQWETWREHGRRIRQHVVEHLDYYLEEFSRNLEAHGQHVHFASDAREAGDIVLRIVAEKEARLVAKSKSMVSEEVGVNARLAEHGIECLETDLGEWIVQLAHETPSHIIIPAIHKTRNQVQDLFEKEGGERLTNDTATLAAYARKRLRARFARAEVGMTGCNFAIAETGSVVIFTNEGNGRMVTTLPQTHIVMMGMERILPTLADLPLMAELLPRSATGQKITTYVNVVTGARRQGELDGPRELHVVILDNGRSRQLADPSFRQLLHCIRCGACLNVCPVYRHVGGHAYGSVYSGPIGAVLTPLLAPHDPVAAELANASTLCGACFDACPVKIPLHDLLLRLRSRNVALYQPPLGERIAAQLFATAAAWPAVFSWLSRLARWLLVRLGPRGERLLTRLPGVSAWARHRSLPALRPRSFRDEWKDLKN